MKFKVLLFLLITSSLLASERDFELWLYNSYEGPLRPKLRYSVFGEGRWRQNASFLFDRLFEGEFIYQLQENVEVALGFRNHWTTPRGSAILFQSHIPFADLFMNYKDQIRYRMRVQYAVRPGRVNDWIIRNRLGWYFPLKKMTPYLMDEVFWRDLDGFFENRAYIGMLLPLKGPFELETFLMKRDIRILFNGWQHNKVLGFRLRYRFEEKKKATCKKPDKSLAPFRKEDTPKSQDNN